MQAMKRIAISQHYFSDALFESGKVARQLKKCGKCGGPGHMKTNKKCPKYGK